VPVSKKRDKNVYKVPRTASKPTTENPRWLVPTALSLLGVGLAWIVVYYISAGKYPLEISYGNIIVGFVLMGAGMVLLTRWK